MQFHLFAIEEEKSTGGGGNSYALKPGAIQNFYQPVDQPKVPLDTYEEPYLVPAQYDQVPKEIYKVVVKWGEKEYDKTVVLNRRGRRVIFTAFNFVNATISKINIMASGLKRITHNARIFVSGFRRKS
jgi:hypothetical protein